MAKHSAAEVPICGNEAVSRVKIDAQLKDEGWDTQNPYAVRYE